MFKLFTSNIDSLKNRQVASFHKVATLVEEQNGQNMKTTAVCSVDLDPFHLYVRNPEEHQTEA